MLLICLRTCMGGDLEETFFPAFWRSKLFFFSKAKILCVYHWAEKKNNFFKQKTEAFFFLKFSCHPLKYQVLAPLLANRTARYYFCTISIKFLYLYMYILVLARQDKYRVNMNLWIQQVKSIYWKRNGIETFANKKVIQSSFSNSTFNVHIQTKHLQVTLLDISTNY